MQKKVLFFTCVCGVAGGKVQTYVTDLEAMLVALGLLLMHFLMQTSLFS